MWLPTELIKEPCLRKVFLKNRRRERPHQGQCELQNGSGNKHENLVWLPQKFSIDAPAILSP